MGVGDGRRTRKENILNPSLDNQGLKSMIIYSFFYYLSAVFMYLCMNVVRYWKDPTEEKWFNYGGKKKPLNARKQLVSEIPAIARTFYTIWI